MKKVLAIITAIGVGFAVVVAYFLRPLLDPMLGLLLQWGIILGSVAALVGIINLLIMHWHKIRQKKEHFVFSFVVLLSFALSFMGGIVLGPQDGTYIRSLAALQVPIEVSLMALLALTLTYAGFQFFRMRGWTPLSLAFGISALLFIILDIGFFQALELPFVDHIIEFLKHLPLAGGRGILIGISLGAFLTALRVLFGAERPYGE